MYDEKENSNEAVPVAFYEMNSLLMLNIDETDVS